MRCFVFVILATLALALDSHTTYFLEEGEGCPCVGIQVTACAVPPCQTCSCQHYRQPEVVESLRPPTRFYTAQDPAAQPNPISQGVQMVRQQPQQQQPQQQQPQQPQQTQPNVPQVSAKDQKDAKEFLKLQNQRNHIRTEKKLNKLMEKLLKKQEEGPDNIKKIDNIRNAMELDFDPPRPIMIRQDTKCWTIADMKVTLADCKIGSPAQLFFRRNGYLASISNPKKYVNFASAPAEGVALTLDSMGASTPKWRSLEGIIVPAVNGKVLEFFARNNNNAIVLTTPKKDVKSQSLFDFVPYYAPNVSA